MSDDRYFRNPDPQFSKRPQHPDFFLLADTVIEHDQKADAGTPIPEIVGEVVDEESLMYILQGRAVRVTAQMGIQDPRLIALVMSAMSDGFMLGVGYARRKQSSEGG